MARDDGCVCMHAWVILEHDFRILKTTGEYATDNIFTYMKFGGHLCKALTGHSGSTFISMSHTLPLQLWDAISG